MKLDTFINRPVLSTVISIFIVLLGLIGLSSLPIIQFPDIAPPTISVSTTYAGANAQAVLNSVIAPLEESINGAEGMTYMESTATNTGSANISVYFEQGFDPDMAAVDVQNRVAKAQNLLPSEVLQVGVTTQKRQSSMLVGIALRCSRPCIFTFLSGAKIFTFEVPVCGFSPVTVIVFITMSSASLSSGRSPCTNTPPEILTFPEVTASLTIL